MHTIRICPVCRNPVAPDAPAGLCPVCLLKSDPAAKPGGEGKSGESQGELAGTGPRAQSRFGGYNIVRPLGQGGMGAVFEAEEILSGRRVALKVLSHSLDSATARQRFLREGRLAASVNHPNSVYIFGTEEIEGQPVITMELATGGTLHDRVRQNGPMAIPEAVDTILQVIAGLEAAARLGVLHRDVKPSNCFVEEDGTVKVGDFGLSISTLARPETNLTASGAVLGTPAYSSPEQLRGDELDVRTDIYSVGATLYYLFTGKTPFTGENMVQLLAQALERTPEAPARLRPELPKELSNLVLRCLAKIPAQRFKTYQELRDALAPFGSATNAPAPLLSRFCAGCLDACAINTIAVVVLFIVLHKSLALSGAADPKPDWPWFQAIFPFVLTALYYGVPEGLWGASLGKAICNLRVLDPSRSVPGLARGFSRAALFAAVFNLAAADFFYGSYRQWEPVVVLVCALGLFASARKTNGWAGLHDFASQTRVVRQRARETRPANEQTEETPPQAEVSEQIGPYHVLSRLEERAGCEILLGYDARLLRKVWIYKQAGAPPLAIDRQALRRPTRLRWLNGRHTPEGSWDAYEAPTGAAFLQSLDRPHPWASVRYWLHDLTHELIASLKDSSLPPTVEMDRVWLTGDGRAKLLEFPAPRVSGAIGVPGVESHTPGAPFRRDDSQLFLKQVAASALAGRPLSVAEIPPGGDTGVLPLPARNFLSQLTQFPDLDQTMAQLTPLLDQSATISRGRRLALMAACCLPSALLMFIGAFIFVFFIYQNPAITQGFREYAMLVHCLDRITTLETAGQTDATKSEREALEIYVTGNFGQTLTNDFFRKALKNSKFTAAYQEMLQRPAPPSAQEIAAATTQLKPFVEDFRAARPGAIERAFSLEIITMLIAWWFGFLVGFPSLIAALVCRGGLAVRALGVAYVVRDGAPAPRWRLVARILLTWSPLLVGVALSPILGTLKAEVIMVALFAVEIAWALVEPQRGLADRLSGTWLVPR